MRFGTGIRILKQDPWEMLISFILSQRKSIPAIRQCVETLAARYGHRIETPYETVYSFPSAKELTSADENALRECKLGYRAPYIADVVTSGRAGELAGMAELDDTALLEALQSFKGVGIKVANCVALFAYGRIRLVPVDTWIQKVIAARDDRMFRENPEVAGIVQQYVFYYALKNKEAATKV